MSSFTKTVTEKQLEANRQNALKSPGPSTPEAKAKVSQNRITHGLCGKFGLLPFESQEQFDALVTALMEAEQPANASEIELVVKMAEHSWRARRALRMQDDCFELEDYDAEDRTHDMALDIPRLETAMRYHTHHERAYRRASQELIERRKQRQLAENGIERKKQAEAEEKRKTEKHELAQDIAKLKKQLLEIRVAKHYMAEMRKITSPKAPQTAEFALAEAKSAA